MPRGISESEFNELIDRAQAALPRGWVLDFANSSYVQFRDAAGRAYVQANVGMFPNRWHARVTSRDYSALYHLGVFETPEAAAIACELDGGAAEERNDNPATNIRPATRVAPRGS
jgi:hypothetical protein